MTTILRPMTTGEVLDRMISLYRNNFVLFFGISTLPALLWVIIDVLLYVLRSVTGGTSGGNVVLISTLVALLAYLIGKEIAEAATIYAVSAVHLGRPTSIRECYRRLRGRYGRVLNVALSVWVRTVGGGILLFIAASMSLGLAAALGPTAGALSRTMLVLAVLLAYLLSGIVVIFLLVRYALAVPACVLEDVKGRRAIKRGIGLSKGGRGRIFAVYFLFFVLWLVFVIARVYVIAMVGPTSIMSHPVLVLIINDGVGFMTGALLGPVVTVALALIYYDQRVRKEAFDIQFMMAALDGPQPPAAAAGVPAGTIG